MYGIRSMRAKRAGDRAGHIKNYIYMIYKDADATLLRLFESFMESAPQLVLQLYILASEHNRFKPSEPLNSEFREVGLFEDAAGDDVAYLRVQRVSIDAPGRCRLVCD